MREIFVNDLFKFFEYQLDLSENNDKVNNNGKIKLLTVVSLHPLIYHVGLSVTFFILQ